MLTTKASETATEYIFSVTDGTEENTFEYRWGKMPPAGQTIEQYLQNCKREAELLAQYEIDKKAEPAPVTL